VTTTTAILSALAEEQQGLIAQLTHPVTAHRAGRVFWRGELGGRHVVLALSKIGKVSAAITATTLIEAFGVDRIVFTGVAGGVGPGVAVGDAVVATGFVQHDMDASPLFPRYEVPLYARRQFDCDGVLTAILLEATQAALAREYVRVDARRAGRQPVVHAGLIASGDRFVSSVVEARSVLDGLQAVGLAPLAVEMEGAAVAQVCFDYGVPFAAVRTISDCADDQASQDFSRFVREVASPCARAIIQNLMPKLP
jgi:adenosylhomocysteine nucleosidase